MQNSRYASRKFILASAVLFVSAWLIVENLIGADDFVRLVLGTVGLYIAGNVGQKAWGKEPPQ